MLKAIRVRNLRSISDSAFLEIRPIVVFVGRNSSGKSTLLRLFPLIKQSVSQDTREPILWYGRSADFGSFDEAVNRLSTDREVSFGFRFGFSSVAGQDFMLTEGGERVLFSYTQPRKLFLNDTPPEVEISLTVRKRDQSEGTFVRSVEVRIGSDVLLMLANEAGDIEPPSFNGRAFSDLPSVRFRFGKGRFFPTLVPVSTEESAIDDPRKVNLAYLSDGPYLEPLVLRLRQYAHGNTQVSTLRKLAASLLFGGTTQFSQYLSQRAQAPKSKLKHEHIKNIRPQELEELRGAVLLRDVGTIFREASAQLANVGAGVRYLEPVRATAARYYRFQELAIDEIDPQGENVPMFLSSLSYDEQRSLEAWMSEALGFQVRATRAGGHAKLLIREAGSPDETNLADTGFGYSQILPIVLQLWKTGRDSKRSPGRRKSPQQVIAVEQPELHLHPHLQALLADLFALSVNAIKGTPGTLSLVVETHSEHLVNRLGALVEKGVLSKDDIVIYLVHRDSPQDATSVQKTTFSDSGTLNDPWPFGFFSPKLP